MPKVKKSPTPERERLSRVVQLRFTESQYTLLQEMAANVEMSVGQLVRHVVDHYLLEVHPSGEVVMAVKVKP